jgi:hypothetical protein
VSHRQAGFGERVKACARAACKDDAFPLCRTHGDRVLPVCTGQPVGSEWIPRGAQRCRGVVRALRRKFCICSEGFFSMFGKRGEWDGGCGMRPPPRWWRGQSGRERAPQTPPAAESGLFRNMWCEFVDGWSSMSCECLASM